MRICAERGREDNTEGKHVKSREEIFLAALCAASANLSLARTQNAF